MFIVNARISTGCIHLTSMEYGGSSYKTCSSFPNMIFPIYTTYNLPCYITSTYYKFKVNNVGIELEFKLERVLIRLLPGNMLQVHAVKVE